MSLVKNKMTPELSLPSDLQEIKTKYDKLQKEYTHLQIESSKKDKTIKKLQDDLHLYVKPSTTEFPSSSDFKKHWEKLVQTGLMDTFENIYQNNKLLAITVNTIVKIIFAYSHNIIIQKTKELLHCLGISSPNQEIVHNFFSKFQYLLYQQYNRTLFPCNDKIVSTLKLMIIKEIKGIKFISESDKELIIKDVNDETSMTLFIKDMFIASIFVHLHDPPLIMKVSTELVYCFYNKNDFVNIEGFPRHDSVCLIILNPPMLKDNKNFKGLKPAVYICDNPTQEMIQKSEEYKILYQNKQQSKSLSDAELKGMEIENEVRRTLPNQNTNLTADKRKKDTGLYVTSTKQNAENGNTSGNSNINNNINNNLKRNLNVNGFNINANTNNNNAVNGIDINQHQRIHPYNLIHGQVYSTSPNLTSTSATTINSNKYPMSNKKNTQSPSPNPHTNSTRYAHIQKPISGCNNNINNIHHQIHHHTNINKFNLTKTISPSFEIHDTSGDANNPQSQVIPLSSNQLRSKSSNKHMNYQPSSYITHNPSSSSKTSSLNSIITTNYIQMTNPISTQPIKKTNTKEDNISTSFLNNTTNNINNNNNTVYHNKQYRKSETSFPNSKRQLVYPKGTSNSNNTSALTHQNNTKKGKCFTVSIHEDQKQGEVNLNVNLNTLDIQHKKMSSYLKFKKSNSQNKLDSTDKSRNSSNNCNHDDSNISRKSDIPSDDRKFITDASYKRNNDDNNRAHYLHTPIPNRNTSHEEQLLTTTNNNNKPLSHHHYHHQQNTSNSDVKFNTNINSIIANNNTNQKRQIKTTIKKVSGGTSYLRKMLTNNNSNSNIPKTITTSSMGSDISSNNGINIHITNTNTNKKYIGNTLTAPSTEDTSSHNINYYTRPKHSNVSSNNNNNKMNYKKLSYNNNTTNTNVNVNGILRGSNYTVNTNTNTTSGMNGNTHTNNNNTNYNIKNHSHYDSFSYRHSDSEQINI